MNPLKKPLHMTLVALVIVQLSACSRTVQWEEEVPLNTGETIWVKRSGTYSFGSESGNPLRFGYNPDWRSTIEFTYKGKKYSHTDAAGLILLAICRVPDDCIDSRRYPLFMAREVMRGLIEQLKDRHEGVTQS